MILMAKWMKEVWKDSEETQKTNPTENSAITRNPMITGFCILLKACIVELAIEPRGLLRSSDVWRVR